MNIVNMRGEKESVVVIEKREFTFSSFFHVEGSLQMDSMTSFTQCFLRLGAQIADFNVGILPSPVNISHALKITLSDIVVS